MSTFGDPPFLLACTQARMFLSILLPFPEEKNHTLSSQLFSKLKKKKSQKLIEIPLRGEKSIFLFFKYISEPSLL